MERARGEQDTKRAREQQLAGEQARKRASDWAKERERKRIDMQLAMIPNGV